MIQPQNPGAKAVINTEAFTKDVLCRSLLDQMEPQEMVIYGRNLRQ